VLLAFSTSGASENLVRAATLARERGLAVIAVTGPAPSALSAAADIAIRIPTPQSALIQELHLLVIHLLCDIVEMELTESTCP
jgi:D-sedoheptulose 7-phosphate isomerase